MKLIWKIVKWIFKSVLFILLLIALAYGGLLGVEYVTGGKFVDYLEKNSETVALGESFDYSRLDEDIKDNNILLVGEIHGFHEPQLIDYEIFTYLNKNHGVKHYIAEVDPIQAVYLNNFLKSGNEADLKKALKKWAVFQGRNNESYFNKYKKLQQYYVRLDSTERFKFIGIDKLQDKELVIEYIEGVGAVEVDESYTWAEIAAILVKVKLDTNITNNELVILNQLENNIEYLHEKVGRELVFFNNFNIAYELFGLQNEKVYGYLGMYHVFQHRVNGNMPFAGMIKNSGDEKMAKVMSINFLMNDSYMVMPSAQLPEFMRQPGKYSKMPISADNPLFIYIYGVQDFKRMTNNNQKSLIKFTGENSPYEGSNRMNTTIQILPVTDVMEMSDEGKDYVQYTVFVRNSDWAKPIEN